MNYCLLNFLIFSVVFQVSEQVDSDRDAGCEYGWRYNQDNNGVLCVLAGTAATWPEASQFCRKNQAKIMTQQERYGYQGFLSSYEEKGWSGELVKYGRLARNEDKTLVATRQFDIIINDTGCSSYLSGFPNARSKRQSDLRQISLINCTDQKLPFMCTKPPQNENIRLSTVSICPMGWLGNESLGTCYKVFHEVYLDYGAAKLSCEEQGGGLMKVHTDVHLAKAFQIINSPLYGQWFSQEGGFDRINLWVDGRDESCNSYFMEFNRTLKWNCLSERPYICSKPVVFNSSTPSLILNPPTYAQEIPIRNEETEIITSYTENGIFPQSFKCLLDNSYPEQQMIQWVKDGAYLAPNSFDNEQILSLDGTLEERLFEDGTGPEPNRFTEEDILGYYWCEVLDLKSNSMKSSNKFYLNYRGTRTYAASLVLSDELVNQVSANSFNLMRTRSSPVETILSFFGNSTQKSPTVKLNRFRSNGRIIDFQVFESSSNSPRSLQRTQSITVESAKTAFLKAYNITTISNGELIKFISTDYCLETKRSFTYDDGTTKEFILPDLSLGSVWYTPDICPIDQLPIGQVECEGNKIYGAYWGTFQLNKNCQFTDHSSSSATVKLAEIAKNISNSSNIDTIIPEVEDLTKDPDVLTPTDISYTTSILDKIVELNNITRSNAIGIVNIINNIQDSDNTNLNIADQDSNVTKRILTTLDQLDTKLITGSNNFLSVVTSKTVLEIRDLEPGKPIQIGLSSNGGKNRPVTSFKEDDLNSLFNEQDMVYATADVGIYLNREFVRMLTNELTTTRIRLAMRLFNDSTLFISKNSTANRFKPNSKIISATLLVNDIPYTDLNNTYITAVFFPYEPLQTEVRQNFSICAFWNIEAGQWSSEGCKYKNTTSGRDVCICDHLTNFAVLLDYYGQDYIVKEEIHRLVLSIITIIGLTLSIIGLSLTVLSFLLFSKLRKGRPQQTLFNLAVAMLCSWIVFLAGINETDDHGGCIAVAVLLHYFILASFMWMLMEGILQYLLFVRVLGTYFENYMWKTAIPAWVLPLVPVIVMLAIDIELYNGGETYCWMSLTGFYYGFAIPVGVIILANIIIYIMVTVSICNRRHINTSSSKSTSRSTFTNIRASFCCFIILGVSWIFGFLAISDARLVFQYIFTIVNSLQGFLIFALFTLRDKNVRDYWKQLCCRGLKSKEHSSNLRNKTSESTPKNSSDLTFLDVRKKSNSSDDINSNDLLQEPYTDHL